MKLFIGADHNGTTMKKAILTRLTAVGDCHPKPKAEDDYPAIARAVAQRVQRTKGSIGILICGSGNGMAMAANRFPEVRAAIALTVAMARKARQDENANVLVLPAWWVTLTRAAAIVQAFLDTRPSPDARHQRRIRQLTRLPRG